MTSRPTIAPPILAALAIVLLPLTVYIGGYFCLGKRMDYVGLSVPSRVEVIERHYSQPWLATIYRPAGKVEELLRRTDVEVMSGPDDSGWQRIDFP